MRGPCVHGVQWVHSVQGHWFLSIFSFASEFADVSWAVWRWQECEDGLPWLGICSMW